LPIADPQPFSRQHSRSDRAVCTIALAGTAAIGAWKKTSEAGRDYLSVKLDEPNLGSDGYSLMSRQMV
jgi:uncharacterized protein (DUF736 family)